jgi:hypothetical protein
LTPVFQRDVADPSSALAATSVPPVTDAVASHPPRDSAGPETFSSRIGHALELVAVWLIRMYRDVRTGKLIVTVAAVPLTFDTTVVKGAIPLGEICTWYVRDVAVVPESTTICVNARAVPMSTWNHWFVDGVVLVQVVLVLPSIALPAEPLFDIAVAAHTPVARTCAVEAVGCPLTVSSSTVHGVVTVIGSVSLIRTHWACCVAKLMTVNRPDPIPFVTMGGAKVVPSFDVATSKFRGYWVVNPLPVSSTIWLNVWGDAMFTSSHCRFCWFTVPVFHRVVVLPSMLSPALPLLMDAVALHPVRGKSAS